MHPSYHILLPGIPAASTHGALGWCTVVLVETDGLRIVFDTGSYNLRPRLVEALHSRGLSRDEIDWIFLSHLHYDHMVNAEIFPRAEFLVAARELAWALEEGAGGDPFVPLSVVRRLEKRLRPLQGEEELAPGIRTLALPGHTPGQMGLLLERDGVLLAGDALKNAWEFTHRVPPPPTSSVEEALRSYDKIITKAQTVVPGHDRPFMIEGAGIRYLQQWRAEITVYAHPDENPRKIPLP